MRDRLLNAAERVVSRDGVKNCTLEAVAQEAGVSKGGLLYHFPSKSALITGVVERLAERCESDQARVLEQDSAEPGCFARAYLAVRTDPLDPAEEPVHTAILAAAGTDPQFLEPFRKRYREWQQRLTDDRIDPEIALIVGFAVDGLCLCRLLGMPVPQGELRARIVERLIAMTHTGTEMNQEK